MKRRDIYGVVALFGISTMAIQYWLSDYSLFPSTVLMLGNVYSIGYLVSNLQKDKTQPSEVQKR